MDDQVFPAVAPADEPLAPPQLMTPPPQRPAPAQALQLVTLAETVELFHSPGGRGLRHRPGERSLGNVAPAITRVPSMARLPILPARGEDSGLPGGAGGDGDSRG